jgi:hypothetical protein
MPGKAVRRGTVQGRTVQGGRLFEDGVSDVEADADDEARRRVVWAWNDGRARGLQRVGDGYEWALWAIWRMWGDWEVWRVFWGRDDGSRGIWTRGVWTRSWPWARARARARARAWPWTHDGDADAADDDASDDGEALEAPGDVRG